MKEYSYLDIQDGKQELSQIEREVYNILINFGASVDYNGYGDGDFTKAMNAILTMLGQSK